MTKNQLLLKAVKEGWTSTRVLAELCEIGTIVSERTARRWLAALRDGEPAPTTERKSSAVDNTTKLKGTGSDSQELDVYSTRVITLDDALSKGDVDLERWEVERFELNSWEVGAKGPDRIIRVTPLWQVKVWLKAKKGWNAREFRDILLRDMKAQAPSYHEFPSARRSRPLMAELSIFDAHFGKLSWAPETGGQDYDINICRDRYMGAGLDLVERASHETPERFVYVVGNDFFHADHKGTTTAGTFVDCDGRWQKAFRVGKECAITLAEQAAEVCPVDIMIVQGNHDREKIFCLGEVLEARFVKHKHINVINEPDPYQYYPWGRVLLGFVHGENHGSLKKRAELPGQMLTDRPLDSHKARWHEWHLGHFHSEQEDVWKYRKVEHVRDVAVRVLPSLSSTDAWHRESGYASVLAAECFMFHKEQGRYNIMSHCVDGNTR